MRIFRIGPGSRTGCPQQPEVANSANATDGFALVKQAERDQPDVAAAVDGCYRLNSPRARPAAGTLIGDYSITVTKYDDLAHTFRPAPTDPEGFARWQNELSEHVRQQEGKTPPLLTPKKYAKPETSPLKATVKKGRNTGPEYSFDLR